MEIRREKKPILFSLSPLFYLTLAILFFKLIFTVTYPHHIALLVSGLLSFLQRIKSSRLFLFSSIRKNFQSVLPAMEILVFVGMLIAAFAHVGVLTTMIQIGLLWIQPIMFLPAICIASALAALVSGSSWTTAGTLGVAFMGVGEVLGFPNVMTAGAIVSGCYFGDKLSPLSDTTNLASSLTHVRITDHIFHMLKTTCISFLISVFLYLILNCFVLNSFSLNDRSLDSIPFDFHFQKNISWKHLIPVVLVFGSSLLRFHVRICLVLGILSSYLLLENPIQNLFDFLHSLIFGYQSTTGDQRLDTFLSGGGIAAILSTEALILSAVWFGGVVEGMGYLLELLNRIKTYILNQSDLLLACMGTSFFLNLVTADQYLSLVIPARAYRNLASENAVPAKDVSRSLEDSGTITSPLIPWNSCGAFMSASLGVSVLNYLPFVFFNLIHVSLAVLFLVWKKKKEKVRVFTV
ncbi:Na+/H+ antiporter NhaC family protein [Leptospira sp. 96542]|nr:Na+/H+ antiporter NhaC family protein [Leptospira sp. 96542]